MTSTRREFLGAVLTVLAWLGVRKAVPEAPATTEVLVEGTTDLRPMDGLLDVELGANAANGDVVNLGVGEYLGVGEIDLDSRCVGDVLDSNVGWIKIVLAGPFYIPVHDEVRG